MILSGMQINAWRAYEIGLVNKVFPADKLLEETKKFAKKLAALPSFALKMAKNAINYGFDISPDNASFGNRVHRAMLCHRRSKRRNEGVFGKKKTDIHREINVQSSKLS